MKTLTKDSRNRSARTSIAIHLLLLLLAFIPFAAQIPAVQMPEHFEISLLQYPAELPDVIQQERIVKFEESTDAGSGSAKPATVNDVEISDEEVSSTEIVSTEETVVMDTVSNTSFDLILVGGSVESGEGSGSDGTEGIGSGEGPGDNGNGGSGVLTRKIIYRPDITKLARENGKITLDICINREGKVKTVRYDDILSTINDPELIKESSRLALKYRFEEDVKARENECGKLTLIFSIESDFIEVQAS